MDFRRKKMERRYIKINDNTRDVYINLNKIDLLQLKKPDEKGCFYVETRCANDSRYSNYKICGDYDTYKYYKDLIEKTLL